MSLKWHLIQTTLLSLAVAGWWLPVPSIVTHDIVSVAWGMSVGALFCLRVLLPRFERKL